MDKKQDKKFWKLNDFDKKKNVTKKVAVLIFNKTIILRKTGLIQKL